MKSNDTVPSAADAAGAAPRARRRSLLLGAGGAGVALVAARLGTQAPAEAVAAAASEPVAGTGYRLTAHVLRYYETTKV